MVDKVRADSAGGDVELLASDFKEVVAGRGIARVVDVVEEGTRVEESVVH